MSLTPIRHATVRIYLTYAAVYLGVAVGIGTWLRAVFVWPWLKGPFTFQYLLHAHSHVAFFGWVTPALFGLTLAWLGPRAEALTARLRWHAHTLGVATGAALLVFALGGYSPPAIALSAVHVVLWYLFAIPVLRALQSAEVTVGAARRDGPLAPAAGRIFRLALLLLLTAGTATIVPALLMVRGVGEGWLKQLGVELFLVPFVGGWTGLGTMAAVYALLGAGRWSRWAPRLVAGGVIPATLLFVAAPAPWPILVWIGRAGCLLLGLGGMAFAVDVLRAWPRAMPLLRLVGAAALAKAALELLAALGVGGALLHARPVVLAYLHLVLLGVATPALILAAYRAGATAGPARARTLAQALGVAVMCGALLGTGWPALGSSLARLGIGFAALFPLALTGGALSAVAGMALLLREPARPGAGARAREEDAVRAIPPAGVA